MSKKKTDEKQHVAVVNETSLNFFEKYINNPSPTGFEWKGQELWLEYIKPYIDEYYVDNYGTAVGIINPQADYKVVIEAHADEISWFVNYITNDGLIYVIRNGGSDHQIAPSKRVNIHTDKGIVKAVFGWPAIHTGSSLCSSLAAISISSDASGGASHRCRPSLPAVATETSYPRSSKRAQKYSVMRRIPTCTFRKSGSTIRSARLAIQAPPTA